MQSAHPIQTILPAPDLLVTSVAPRFLHSSERLALSGSLFCDVVGAPSGIADHMHRVLCLQYLNSHLRVRDLGVTTTWSTVPAGMCVWLPGQRQRREWGNSTRSQLLFIRPERVEQILGRSVAPSLLAFGRRGQSTPAFVKHVLFALVDDIAGGSPAGALAGDSLIAGLISWLAEAAKIQESPAERTGTLGTDTYTRLIDFIEANLAYPISLEELSTIAGFSQRHFSRLLKARTGLSPHKLILSRRVERVAELLRSGRLGLAEIASETGFADQSQMSKIFKSFVGLTPSRYRLAASK